MPVDSAWFRRQAEELEKEEAEAKRELDNAETAKERETIHARLDRLDKENAELRERLKEHRADKPAKPKADPKSDPSVDEDEDEEQQPRMRKGRKHGVVYQNPDTGMGEVYTGEDEDDLVPVDDDEEAA